MENQIKGGAIFQRVARRQHNLKGDSRATAGKTHASFGKGRRTPGEVTLSTNIRKVAPALMSNSSKSLMVTASEPKAVSPKWSVPPALTLRVSSPVLKLEVSKHQSAAVHIDIVIA